MPGLPTIDPYPFPGVGDLTPNIAPWTFDPDRAVLLLHDVQRFFLRPFPASVRDQLLHNAARLRREFAAAGVPVAYTAQPGAMTTQDRGLLRDFWGPGMNATPADREVESEVAPSTSDWRLTKWRYSAFFRTDLLARMRAEGRDQLVICGVYAHVGVLCTAVEAFTNDIETFLVADAVADFSERHHRLALEYAARCCAVVTETKELLS